MVSRELLVEQIPQLRRYARVLLGHARVGEADDLVQDTLERACARWSLWQSQRSLRPWLFSIMHNLFVDQIAGAVPAQALDEVDEPQVAAQQELRVEALGMLRLVQELALPLREVVLLVCVEGLAYREAAQALGIPIGTVMSRLSRARAQLQQWTQHTAGAQAAARPALQVVVGKAP